MKDFTFNIPTKIIFRKGISESFNKEIPSYFTNILFVTDKTITKKTNIVKKIQKALSNRNVFLFDDVFDLLDFDVILFGFRDQLHNDPVCWFPPA